MQTLVFSTRIKINNINIILKIKDDLLRQTILLIKTIMKIKKKENLRLEILLTLMKLI
jgi:hypothetical protein